VDFLLQPCPVTSTYVARRAQHQEEAEVPQGSTLLWRFSVGDGLDIQFSAVFTPTAAAAGSSSSGLEQQQEEGGEGTGGGGGRGRVVVLMEGRFPAAQTEAETEKEKGSSAGVVQGSFTAPAAGSCVLTWDNAYSRLRGKQVRRGSLSLALSRTGWSRQSIHTQPGHRIHSLTVQQPHPQT